MKVIKELTSDFYYTMLDWWEGHSFPPVSPLLMPTYTFVCYNDSETPTHSVCFYYTDSKLAWIGWELSNPFIPFEEKEGGLDYLIAGVNLYAKEMGFEVLFTTSGTEVVENILIDNGYSLGDTNVNHYLKKL